MNKHFQQLYILHCVWYCLFHLCLKEDQVRAVDKDFCIWAFHPQILFLMGDLTLWCNLKFLEVPTSIM